MLVLVMVVDVVVEVVLVVSVVLLLKRLQLGQRWWARVFMLLSVVLVPPFLWCTCCSW